jgi:hypothetical protein
MEIKYSLGNYDSKLEGGNFVLTLFTTIILAFGDWFRKTGSDHVAGEGFPYPSAIAQIITATSIKLCISKTRAFSFVLYEMRRPCNNLLYHIFPKSFKIILKINIFLGYFLLLAFHMVLETTTRSVLKMGSNIRDDLISSVLLRTPGTCRSCWCFATEL